MAGAGRARRPGGEEARHPERAVAPARPAPAPADDAAPEHSPLLDLQRQVGNAGVQELVDLAGSEPGRPLDPDVRASMEASFGRSFAGVEVHEGPAVDRAAEGLGAAAFAAGEDVFLRSDVDPGTPPGREVLGEELAHVAQGVGANRAAHLLPPEGGVEQEAHRAAHEAAEGRPAAVSFAPAAATGVGRFLDPISLGVIGGIGYGVKKLYEELTEEEVEATKPDPDQPTQATVDAIKGGVPPQLDAAVAKLGGDPTPANSKAAAASLSSVKDFLIGQLPPTNQGPVMSVLLTVTGAINTLEAAADPTGVLKELQGSVAAKKAELDGLVASAKEPAVGPDGKELPPDALTPDQASILSSGPVVWMGEAATMLAEPEPDPDLIAGKLDGAAGAIRSVNAPPAVLPQLTKIALNCGLYAETAKATKLTVAESVPQAMAQLEAAKSMIAELGVPPEIPPE
ncbi:MAG: eCIS core domain-containing protein [Actinomycetota bacterium]